MNVSVEHRILLSLFQEMAWCRIGAMPILELMLIFHRLEHNEKLSVNFFLKNDISEEKKRNFVRHFFNVKIAQMLRVNRGTALCMSG